MRVGDQIVESIEAHTTLRGSAARRKAMELEQAALSVENVDWSACSQMFNGLVSEMDKVRPALANYVATRTIL